MIKQFLLGIGIIAVLVGCREKIIQPIIENEFYYLQNPEWRIVEDLKLEVEFGVNDSIFLMDFYPTCKRDDRRVYRSNDSVYVLEKIDICAGNTSEYVLSYYRLDTASRPMRMYYTSDEYWNIEILNEDTLKLKRIDSIGSWTDSSIYHQTYISH